MTVHLPDLTAPAAGLAAGPRPAAARRAGAWRACAGALLPVLGLHAALLQSGPAPLPPVGEPARQALPVTARVQVQVRPQTQTQTQAQMETQTQMQMQMQAQAQAEVQGPARAPVAGTGALPGVPGSGKRGAPQSAPSVLPPRVTVASGLRADPAPGGFAAPGTAVHDTPTTGGDVSEPSAGPHTELSDDASPAVLLPPPLYATQLPPPARLVYRLRRGAFVGQAVLDWQPDGPRYRLRLQGDPGATGPAALGWASHGEVDAHGLAPVRHVEVHKGRERRAVNFQRGAGVVSYSAPLPVQPLLAGTQDRLSWLVQMAAVMQANPTLAAPGASLQLLVVGTRGPQRWHFSVTGQEDLAQPGAVHLRRDPTHPYDVQVDVWLDPAQHHWPLRVRWFQAGSGQVQELQQAAAVSP